MIGQFRSKNQLFLMFRLNIPDSAPCRLRHVSGSEWHISGAWVVAHQWGVVCITVHGSGCMGCLRLLQQFWVSPSTICRLFSNFFLKMRNLFPVFLGWYQELQDLGNQKPLVSLHWSCFLVRFVSSSWRKTNLAFLINTGVKWWLFLLQFFFLWIQ